MVKRVRKTVVFAALLFSLPGISIAIRAQTPAGASDLVKSMSREDVMTKLTAPTWTAKPVPADGAPLFQKACAMCHIFGDIGASIGPDLTTLASRFKKRDILDSILWPSKTISDQYEVTMVEMNDGTIHNGLIFREDRQYLYLKNADHLDRPLAIKLADIKERAVSKASLMPEGLVNEMTLQQVDNLIAYLLAGPK